MTPLHGIACFCDIGFGARAVSRKTPIYFIVFIDTHFWQVKHVFVLEWINDVKEFLHRGIIEVHCEVHFPIGL